MKFSSYVWRLKRSAIDNSLNIYGMISFILITVIGALYSQLANSIITTNPDQVREGDLFMVVSFGMYTVGVAIPFFLSYPLR